MNRKAGPVDLEVGARLKQRRLELGLTQQQLANAIGVKFQQIQKYERGSNRVSSSNLFALANILQADLSYFFSPSSDNYNFPDTTMALHASEEQHDYASTEKGKHQLRDLIHYFARIKDPFLRQKLLDLAKSFSESTK